MAHTSLQIWGHHSDFISSYTESLGPINVINALAAKLKRLRHLSFLSTAKIYPNVTKVEIGEEFFNNVGTDFVKATIYIKMGLLWLARAVIGGSKSKISKNNI